MENGFYTLQQFMLHTESVTYLLIVASLIGICCYWFFLTGRDDDH